MRQGMNMDSIRNNDSDEKVRRVGIAVASWLCGVLEGSTRDSADMGLAEALDAWLRYQKNERRVLFTGSLACSACGHTWESLVASDDTGGIQCPQCGHLQKVNPCPSSARTEPENKESLEKVQRDANDIVTRIAELNKIISANNGLSLCI